MNKDVIYIDVEDDITTIISKIKASKERIIALVPPRRIGVFTECRQYSITGSGGNFGG